MRRSVSKQVAHAEHSKSDNLSIRYHLEDFKDGAGQKMSNATRVWTGSEGLVRTILFTLYSVSVFGRNKYCIFYLGLSSIYLSNLSIPLLHWTDQVGNTLSQA